MGMEKARPGTSSEEGSAGLITKDARARIIRADAASFTTLSRYERSPAHARWMALHPPEPSAAMEIGTAVHLAVLEPERFDAECAIAPKIDRRTKEGKAEWSAFLACNAGKTVLDAQQHERCLAMRDAVWAHETAAAMLSGTGHFEVGAIWEDAATGQLCKTLIDRMGSFDGWTWCIDLKKTRDASKREFAKSVARYHYHAQAAMILDGCNAISPRERKFAWIAVEEEPPHCVAIYEPNLVVEATGRDKWRKWLGRYVEAKRAQSWPGYSRGVVGLELPKWAYYDEEENER